MDTDRNFEDIIQIKRKDLYCIAKLLQSAIQQKYYLDSQTCCYNGYCRFPCRDEKGNIIGKPDFNGKPSDIAAWLAEMTGVGIYSPIRKAKDEPWPLPIKSKEDFEQSLNHGNEYYVRQEEIASRHRNFLNDDYCKGK